MKAATAAGNPIVVAARAGTWSISKGFNLAATEPRQSGSTEPATPMLLVQRDPSGWSQCVAEKTDPPLW